MASAAVQDQLEIRFRLIDGSDIGPKSFPVSTSVASLKENILSQWPKEADLQNCNERLKKEFLNAQAEKWGILHELKFRPFNNADAFVSFLRAVFCLRVKDLKLISVFLSGQDKLNGPKSVKDLKLISVFLSGQDKLNGPKSVKDLKLISAGRILENNRTVADCRSPLYDVPGGVTTMHVIVQPPSEKEKKTKTQSQPNKCGCVIM